MSVARVRRTNSVSEKRRRYDMLLEKKGVREGIASVIMYAFPIFPFLCYPVGEYKGPVCDLSCYHASLARIIVLILIVVNPQRAIVLLL